MQSNLYQRSVLQIEPSLLKTILVIMAIIVGIPVSYAENRVTGHWEGQIDIPGQPITVKVDLTINDSDWSGTIDIPTQGAKGLPLSDIHVEKNDAGVHVKFSIRGVPGNPTFDGKLQDSAISGTFSQGGATFGFQLSRESVKGPARPQEPKPPFPYKIEEVTFQNGAVNLAGTLTLPQGDGPFPAVLLISGSGLQDRDETLVGHKPFWVLADHLSRAGIAVLRVDDPGIGQSTPHPKPPTTADFATDVEAGVAFLKQDDRMDRIGLIGHSEGGLIAAIVASRSNDVGFVVLMAGPGVPGAELLRKQNERIFDAAGISGERKQHLLTLLDQLFTILTAEDMAEDERRQGVDKIVRKQLEINGVPPAKQEETQVQALVEQALTPWMRYFLTFDPRPALEKIRVPVLALNGKLDVQVDAEQNLTAIAAALEKGGNQNFTVHRLPEHNHLFQRAHTGLMNEYGAIEETLSPMVLDLIRDWILSVTQ
ncbi:alpha/beta hydrolase [Candidatus Poribacteria bacterium]|nr:alpha/beta hydrolase [Candidatus Poribacteria bacterium]MYG05716.1 alpha/beta hydrolase [Candidatus Poribacteria bacterium]MYK23400.1 alpha/beta hydrolase [Candidatus Poribacteria bacterium]